jgi:hypothetical protein
MRRVQRCADSRAVELYRSSTGLLAHHKELLTSAHGLKQDAQELLEGSNSSSSSHIGLGASTEDMSLQNLVALCNELADKLIGVLDDFKPKPGNNRKWEAVRQTVRSAYRDAAVNGLVGRMRQLRDALNTHLLTVLNYEFHTEFFLSV